MLPLHQRSALELAALLRDREVSAVELMEHTLGRIEAHDPQLNAFTEVFPRRALRAAAAVDRRLAKGGPTPSLLGVPTAIKDTDAVRFAWNRAGSRAYRWVWSPLDGPAVKMLRRAGVLVAGKTTTSELALLPLIETDLAPPTANPWDTARSAGGSSGGSAAAVAGGLLPIAHAADGGGSIRIPASLCHLFGFKPSRGLTRDFYATFDTAGISTTGCVSHTVEDTAAWMDALRGDVAWPPGPDTLLARCRQPPPTSLRVKLCLRSPTATAAPGIAAGVEAVGRLLEDLGHHVELVTIESGTVDEFLPIYQRVAANLPALSERFFQPVTRWLRAAGRKLAKTSARERRQMLGKRVLDWFGDADLALTPAVGRVAPPHYLWRDLEPEAVFHGAAELGAFTATLNLSGQPAAAVPIGLSADEGLPFAAQIIGPVGGDALVLQIARVLEERLDWRARRAPMAG